jgi:predicted methyltransferase
MNKTTTVLLALVLSACGQQADGPDTAAVEPIAAEPEVSVYEAAVANESRPDADRERDSRRKPAEVLEFMGVAPGMTILDMFSGGGYYTEILSHIVGPEGQVIAHSNEAYLTFVGDEFDKRYLGGRLANAQVLMAENNELSLEANSLDGIMLVLSFHDFFLPAADGWPAIEIQPLLAELHNGLRAGGFVGVIDHYAADGALPSETGSSTHRIDPAVVIREMTAAGFVLDRESDILRNPDDDYDRIVFDPDLRGKSDRFVMRFVKAR